MMDDLPHRFTAQTQKEQYRNMIAGARAGGGKSAPA
jgi:hypothetical protein